jgi:transcriptional regulator with XRE-family HTH domain
MSSELAEVPMAKKHIDPAAEAKDSAPGVPQSLGDYLTNIRSVKHLTLRQVEEATGGEVSNAYLSQLETSKISRPSPNILHALARVYGVPYEILMEKAGYISPVGSSPNVLRSGGPPRHGRAATFVNENLTPDEEEKLLEYLAFLRSRRGRGGKT